MDNNIEKARKLATIQKIKNIRPIEGADRIQVADVLGWHLVIKKDEFKENDLCVYCEVDSVLPEKPEFEFLKERKYRIKTIKLRKQISQGIAFQPKEIGIPEDQIFEGNDVTEILNITKFEPYVPEQLRGQAKGSFPGFLIKTDEIRIQSVPEYLDESDNWYISEKLDGTSFTAYRKLERVGVCSRNLELKLDPENKHHEFLTAYSKIFKLFNLEEKLRSFEKNFAFQGEIIGSGIQKNKYNLKQGDLRVYFFILFDINNYCICDYNKFTDTFKNLGLNTVPILNENFSLKGYTVDSLVELSKGKSIVNPNSPREGIVIRKKDGSKSFKVINPDFLLKYDE